MSYTLVFVADLISTGLTPSAKLFDTAGAQVGATIASGIVEALPRVYIYKATIPDGQEGVFVIYDPADTTDHAAFSVEPKEAENTDAKISTRATPAQVASAVSLLATASALATTQSTVNAIGLAITALNNLSSAQVQTAAAAALIAYDPPTNAELDAAVSGLPAGVWAHTPRTLTSFGTLVADMVTAVWAAAVRTLTMTAQQITAAMEGDPLPIYKSVTFNFTFTGLTIPADWVKIWFTLKKKRGYTDAQADVQVMITNGGHADDGITVLNAAASTVTTKPYGALVINQAAGTAALTIQDDGTALLTSNYGTREPAVYDLKVKDASGATVIINEGTATLDWAITRQI